MNNTHRDDTNDDDHGKLVFLQYRGKISEEFEQSLIICGAPCQLVFYSTKVEVGPSIIETTGGYVPQKQSGL